LKKSFVVDTCALMEKENAVEILRNGIDNTINIPITVINELDHLLKNKTKRYSALKVVKNI
jgi:predicted ribonuclease YlaK